MRIELPHKCERFGANLFYAPVQVYELDSGLHEEPEAEQRAIVAFPHGRIYDIQRHMAVVVPVRGERVRLIEGILFAIPSQCLVVVVSNSPREPHDRYHVEESAIRRFARMARKRVVLVHQKDPLMARAFAEAGYPDLLGDDGLIRDGKAEGMLLGTALAHLAGKKYVGFVDADNYSPGAAYEYIREYAAGFALADTPFSMVRILWQSKPKVMDGHLYFARFGRTSRLTNHFLNALVGRYTGFETDIIATGNAGEHALSMDLALRIDYGAGYAVEPQHIVSLLEAFGGQGASPYPEVIRQGVEVFQVESRSPHFHEAGEDDHIHDMSRVALGAIHGSPLCPEALRREIEQAMIQNGIIEPGADIVAPRRYPCLDRLDFERFRDLVARGSRALSPLPEDASGWPSGGGTWPSRWARGERFPGMRTFPRH